MDPEQANLFARFAENTLEVLLNHKPNDIPICQTRVIRQGRGWPWNYRLALHPRPDGGLEITRIP